MRASLVGFASVVGWWTAAQSRDPAANDELIDMKVQLKCSQRREYVAAIVALPFMYLCRYVDRFCSLAAVDDISCMRLHERAKSVCNRRGHVSEQLLLPVRHRAMVMVPVVVDGNEHQVADLIHL